MDLKKQRGFTLIEILVVVAIIAILALAIIPNYVGFDVDARVVTTKSNLSMIRNRISLYRAKEGSYPETLQDLVEKTYMDAGIEKPYMKQIPSELILDKSGINTVRNQTSSKSFTNTGGWVYVTDKADVVINSKQPLDKKWESYEGQKPSEW
jgi:prepilin-type N-terminal cleavage/methylation domain-containing protein